MRVVGIDPGTYVTGWGVVENAGNRLTAIDAGVVKVSKKTPLAERLRVIHEGLCGVLKRHEPHVVAVEDLFYGKFANPALKLGHVRGVALLAGASAGLDVLEYSPALVKRTVAGRGRADKQQIAQLVGALLGYRDLPPLDATDALAVAITAIQASRARSGGRIKEQLTR